MADDWIKMRLGIDRDYKSLVIAHDTSTSITEVLSGLFRVAEWFHSHGKYGVMEDCDLVLIDRITDDFMRGLK